MLSFEIMKIVFHLQMRPFSQELPQKPIRVICHHLNTGKNFLIKYIVFLVSEEIMTQIKA